MQCGFTYSLPKHLIDRDSGEDLLTRRDVDLMHDWGSVDNRAKCFDIGDMLQDLFLQFCSCRKISDLGTRRYQWDQDLPVGNDSSIAADMIDMSSACSSAIDCLICLNPRRLGQKSVERSGLQRRYEPKTVLLCW